MRFFTLSLISIFAVLVSVVMCGDAFAALPNDIWAQWLPDAASPIKERVHHFHELMMIIITSIVIVVAAAMVYTIWRYRAKKNPVPSTTTHNVPLEIVWTLIPCLILVVIMWFSLPLMYYMDTTAKPDLTLKVTGYQWYWGYSYPEQEIEEYTLYMVPSESDDPKNEFAALRAKPTYQRLLSNYELSSGQPGFVVLPVQKNIRVLTGASDVLHSFALPAFGVKKDAVPGRANETWIRINKPGIYYGQCSELCGTKHAYMPIEVRAVTPEQFDAWVATMKTDPAAAFAQVDLETAQYAHPQITAPHLTLTSLVDIVKEKLNR